MNMPAHTAICRAAAVLACLPVLAFFRLMELCPAGGPEETFLWIYPFYVVLAGFCAWKCAGTRTALAWIIVVLLLLSHAAMWILVDPSLLLPK